MALAKQCSALVKLEGIGFLIGKDQVTHLSSVCVCVCVCAEEGGTCLNSLSLSQDHPGIIV